MGEARNRGTKEERIAQAQSKSKKPASASPPSPRDFQGMIELASRLDPAINALTTPEAINEQVLQFASHLSSQPPRYLTCEPELWSRDSCCDLNVQKYIEKNGGKMLCGYRIWYTAPRYIEGERHAVWTDGEKIRDVSFASSGERQIVFVPDDIDFEGAPGKVRFVFEEKDKAALNAYEQLAEAMTMSITKPTAEMAWKAAETYESWLASNRP